MVLEQVAAALRTGCQAEAVRLLQAHLLRHPRDVAAVTRLAELFLDLRKVEEATILLRRAVGVEPSPRRQIGLVRHLAQFAGAEPAILEIEGLAAELRSTPELLAIEAALRGSLGQHDRQIAIYERLIALEPGNWGLWKTLGDALKTVGRTSDAIAALGKAIEARPTYGEAWWTLANFKSASFSDADISAMRKVLRGKLASEDALHFHFALGQAYEDRKDFAKSFQHYEAGNGLRRAGLTPEAMRVTAFVDQAIEASTAELFGRNRDNGANASDPIFIVGLHRSGSTLIEQILSSHPMIEGTSELTILPQLWERLARTAARSGKTAFQLLDSLDEDGVRSIGEEYLERARAFRKSDRPRFVDKLPANWMYVSMIRLALPNARIIDARRHPLACGFSNFKQNYATGVTFSYSLESIGHFYRDYVRFMDHVDMIQPGAVHRLLNERLIEDLEGETRALLEFVGVPFDAACLEFHRNKRAVQTPSAEQVRRPINRDGVNSWRKFEPWLGPLKEALGSTLRSWDQ